MFDNLSFGSLRLIALITHFVVTTGLLWTRNDSLQVTLKASASRNEFKEINSAYVGIISFALISLILEMIMLLLAPKRVSLFSAIKLFLDVIGSFFIAWIILDGLEWLTYVYIFVFCVTIPTALEVFMLIMEINKNIWVDWRSSRSLFNYLWEAMEYVWSWIAYITACMCSSSPHTTSNTCDFSAITASCMGCLTMIQTEGISGMCQYWWQCLQSPFQTSPSALLESCFNSVSSICTSTTQCCSSLGTALMQGPNGVIEFCTEGITSCGQQGSVLLNIWEFFAYIGTAITSSCSYIANSLYTFSAEYAPIIYESLIALRDYIWSWLMWFWRQIQLFCT